MDSNSIDLSSDVLTNTISVSLSSAVGADTDWLSGGNYTYATNTGTSYAWNTTSIDNTLQVRGNSQFDGDVTVKGRSLTEFMDSVEQRLNILRPDPRLESEWDQLRALGEQYRELERQLLEKEKIWKILKR